MQAAIGKEPDLRAILDFYVSKRHRDNMADCCPMLASASEAARQSASLRSTFAQVFDDLVEVVGRAADDRGDEWAIMIAASMIGIVAVVRALRGPDP
jgi:TetR/AcrR family transcriptional repressor of nem operon